MKYSPRVTSGLRPCVIDWPREHTHTRTRNIHHTGVHDTHKIHARVQCAYYYSAQYLQ